MLSGCVAKSGTVKRNLLQTSENADLISVLAQIIKSMNPTPMANMVANQARANAMAAAKLAREDPSFTGDFGQAAGGIMGLLMGGSGAGSLLMLGTTLWQRNKRMHAEKTAVDMTEMDADQSKEHAKARGLV